MRYIATIVYKDGSSSKLFSKQKDAENWLDSENNNLENETYVTVYDDHGFGEWKLVETYPYTYSCI